MKSMKSMKTLQNGKNFGRTNALSVLILTFDLDQKMKSNKYLPKVCHKIGEKLMIEIILETVLKLNPYNIILYVSKNNIECINKVLKYTSYSRLITYYILPNYIPNRKLSIALPAIKNRNILLVPGNAPLLTYNSLSRLVGTGTNNDINIIINKNLFYLCQKDVANIDVLNFNQEPSGLAEVIIPSQELKQIETRGDLEEVINILDR